MEKNIQLNTELKKLVQLSAEFLQDKLLLKEINAEILKISMQILENQE